jgi:hypothetical protein
MTPNACEVKWIEDTVKAELLQRYPNEADRAGSEAQCWAAARQEELYRQFRDGIITYTYTYVGEKAGEDWAARWRPRNGNQKTPIWSWSNRQLLEWILEAMPRTHTNADEWLMQKELIRRFERFDKEMRRLRTLAAERAAEKTPGTWFELEVAESVLRMYGHDIPHGKQVS